MSPGRHSTVTSAQREELWHRYRAGETVLGIARALGQGPKTSTACCKLVAVLHRLDVRGHLGYSVYVSVRRSPAASLPALRTGPSPEGFNELFLR
jgi:hypothetical protein